MHNYKRQKISETSLTKKLTNKIMASRKKNWQTKTKNAKTGENKYKKLLKPK